MDSSHRGSVMRTALPCHGVIMLAFVWFHYDDVIMSTIASQITSLTVVYSTVYSGADQSKHQSSASLAFVWGIHRGPVNSPHKWPVTRKMFPFDDVIMYGCLLTAWHLIPIYLGRQMQHKLRTSKYTAYVQWHLLLTNISLSNHHGIWDLVK